MENNKKGFTTITLIFMIFAGFALIFILGIQIYAFDLVDDSLSDIDIQLGNISFNETYEQMLQPGIIAMKTTMPRTIGIGTLLGMVIVMVIIGYKSKKIDSLWITLDILIIIIAEIISVVVRDSFTTFINSSPEFLAIFSNEIPLASKFILNLPIIVPTVGVLIIVATYFITKEPEQDVFR